MNRDIIRVRVLKKVGGFNVGQVIRVKSEHGHVADAFWARRLKDAERDGCCEIIEEETTPTADNTEGSQAEDQPAPTTRTTRKKRRTRSTK